MGRKAVVSLTTGLEDTEKVTVALLVAVGAAESGRPTLMFLTKEAVRLAIAGFAAGVGCDGCPSVTDLMQRFEVAGGRYYACPICLNSRKQGRRAAGRQRGGSGDSAHVGVDRRRGRHDVQLLTAARLSRELGEDEPARRRQVRRPQLDRSGCAACCSALPSSRRRLALRRKRLHPSRNGVSGRWRRRRRRPSTAVDAVGPLATPPGEEQSNSMVRCPSARARAGGRHSEREEIEDRLSQQPLQAH
jgi:predicted peroxiredoxin